MKLLKFIFFVQLCFLCQAFQNLTTQTDPTDVHVSGKGNNTESQEKLSNDPYVHHLGSKCRWTFRMPGNRSRDMVALPAASVDLLAEQICQDFECGRAYHVNKTSSPPNTTCFHRCFYNHGHLQNCSERVESTCNVVSEVVCGHQAVRLSGGSDHCAGRVEIWRDEKWGTVCDDHWDLNDAHVVCAQLGCGYALSVTGQAGSFPPGKGPIYLDDLNCTGKEENLWACPATQEDHDCGHKEDAGIVCSEMRAVRLTGGLDRCSGKVEIHRNGSWGMVCDNCWNKDMASIVCSMLQCGKEPQKFSQFEPPLAHNNGTLWYYQCKKHNQNLWQCKEVLATGVKAFLCAGSKASGVICNGSLGFPNVTTPKPAVTTEWTTVGNTTFDADADSQFSSPLLLCTITLSLLLLVIVITNTMLCCHYRNKHAFLLQQTRTNPRPMAHNNYHETVNLIKVNTNPPQTDVHSNPRHLWTQLSSADSTSVDTDYEQYDPSNDPSVSLSTFRNSQRYRTDINPLMRPSALESLCEEGHEPTNKAAAAFPSYNGGPSHTDYARVSKISVDSFESSSTSSGECYENVTKGYYNVNPDSKPGQFIGTCDPPHFSYDKLCSEQVPNLQNSDDDELYSPVSPD